MSTLYLIINLCVLIIPLLFSWHPRIRFVDGWPHFIRAVAIVAVLFIVWDIFFAAKGIWGFNPSYLVGINLLGLPLEEWLFFLCIPYSCVFTYHVFSKLESSPGLSRHATRVVLLAICLLALILVVTNIGRWYSATVGAVATMYAGYLVYRSPDYAGCMLFSMALLVIPFVLTNGVLTGLTFWEFPLIDATPYAIADHIVWYNDDHNIRVRLFSIPLEDFFYAFVLIGSNISLFEHFRSKSRLVVKSSAA